MARSPLLSHRGLLTALILLLVACPLRTAAQPPDLSPFALPFSAAPSPGTWLVDQLYGNTVEAHNFGRYWYASGQGLHFGLDLEARCGTPVLSIGDGTVEQIDAGYFGAGPHNLVVRHERQSVVAIYGHLLQKPTLTVGQPIQRGQPIGLVGDPDLNCRSRPHLHLEIRSLDYRTAYNPAQYIRADWNALYSLQQPDSGGFAKDVRFPNRWQRYDDQPAIAFNDQPLNRFESWLPPFRSQPPATTLPGYVAAPLGTEAPATRRLTLADCCTRPWWSPDGRHLHYLDNPAPDADPPLAKVMQIAVHGALPRQVGVVPPVIVSPDGRYEVRTTNGTMTLVHRDTRREFVLFTRGAYPRFSPDSRRLLWHVRPADDIPGEIPPLSEIWLADVATGEPQLLRVQSGGHVRWLDNDRLLLVKGVYRSQQAAFEIFTLSTGQLVPLITLDFVRALSVSPGGKYLMFYRALQESPVDNGVFVLETRPGARPRKLPFFGGWRWRDSRSVIYVPFAASPMQFRLFDVPTGDDLPLTDPARQPLRIAIGDWDVAPHGNRIYYVSATDGAIWLLELPAQKF